LFYYILYIILEFYLIVRQTEFINI